jgi:hypothetical protein
MFLRNIYNTIIGILLEVGFVALIVLIAYLLGCFVVWVGK